MWTWKRLAPELVAHVAPLVMIVPGVAAVLSALWRASWATLGRDQGIFQYIAWAARHGERLYRDVRDVNGPVIPLIHVVFQWLGGEDEHRFRSLDLGATSLSFLVAGALIARRARIAWALAAWVALSAQYLVYSWWDIAQRESYLDWFVLVSIAAVYATPEVKSKRGTALALVAGATSIIPWLGKPTFALFTIAEVVTIVLESDRRRRLALFALGGALGALVPVAFLLAYGDVGAFAKITFVDVPTMYRFIWPRPWASTLTLPGYDRVCALALATSVATGVAIAFRLLPRRAIPIAAMPVLGIASVLLQAKGFPYHFHPVTLGMTFAWIVLVAAAAERASRTWQVVGGAGALLVGVHAGRLAIASWYPTVEESRTSLEIYTRYDYFPVAMREGAATLEARTAPSDRVQMYGMDAYVLFLAHRLSATPYIYAYDLNADAALAGAAVFGGPRPSDAEQAAIAALRDAHSEDLFRRLEAKPPAAFLLVSASPLMTVSDAAEDLAAHSPAVDAYLREHYTEIPAPYPLAVYLHHEDAPPAGPRSE